MQQVQQAVFGVSNSLSALTREVVTFKGANPTLATQLTPIDQAVAALIEAVSKLQETLVTDGDAESPAENASEPVEETPSAPSGSESAPVAQTAPLTAESAPQNAPAEAEVVAPAPTDTWAAMLRTIGQDDAPAATEAPAPTSSTAEVTAAESTPATSTTEATPPSA